MPHEHIYSRNHYGCDEMFQAEAYYQDGYDVAETHYPGGYRVFLGEGFENNSAHMNGETAIRILREMADAVEKHMNEYQPVARTGVLGG